MAETTMEEDDNIYLESQLFSDYQPKSNPRKRRASHVTTGVKNRRTYKKCPLCGREGKQVRRHIKVVHRDATHEDRWDNWTL